MRRVVGGGLVGDEVGADAAAAQLREDLGSVAEESDRARASRRARLLDEPERLVEVAAHSVEVALLDSPLDAARPALHRQHRGAGHGRGERLGAAHAAKPGGQDPAAAEIAGIVFAPGLDKGLVGALDDALAADIDP